MAARGWSWKIDYRRAEWGNFGSNETILYLDCGSGYTTVYNCQNLQTMWILLYINYSLVKKKENSYCSLGSSILVLCSLCSVTNVSTKVHFLFVSWPSKLISYSPNPPLLQSIFYNVAKGIFLWCKFKGFFPVAVNSSMSCGLSPFRTPFWLEFPTLWILSAQVEVRNSLFQSTSQLWCWHVTWALPIRRMFVTLIWNVRKEVQCGIQFYPGWQKWLSWKHWWRHCHLVAKVIGMAVGVYFQWRL